MRPLRATLDWIDRHAAWFVLIGMVGFSLLGWRLLTDEQRTREVQNQGAPAQACLLEIIRHAQPLLKREPGIEAPLAAYLRIEAPRFPDVRCPLSDGVRRSPGE